MVALCEQHDITYAVDQVEDQPHGYAELLKVQAAIIVHVRQIPDPLKLVVSQLTVLEYCRSLVTVEKLASIG